MRKLFPRFFLHSAPSTFPNLFPIRTVCLFPHLLSTDACRKLVPNSFLHSASSSTHAFRTLFPRFFLHRASRSFPPAMLTASYFHDFSFLALPVPLLHRCFPQAISRVFLPVPLLQRRVSQAISTIFPPDTFPAVFRTHFAAPKRALRYRGAPGSETKREPKHRRCFWEKKL